jgi:hypothetical protein
MRHILSLGVNLTVKLVLIIQAKSAFKKEILGNRTFGILVLKSGFFV